MNQVFFQKSFLDVCESHDSMVEMELNKIQNRDALEGLRELPDNSIDLIITSPVYKDSDGFSWADIELFAREMLRVQKENSLLFLNFGALAEDKFRPFGVCKTFTERGYRLNDTIIWVKNHYRPIQGKKRLNNLCEFIFLLYKGEMPNLDRLSIGVPYKDKSNAKRFANGRDLKCRGNVWEIPYETINRSKEKLHNDRFPLMLPELCIKLSGIPNGAVVLDPFSGSATVACAAKKLNKQFIGFEIDKRHWKTGSKRLLDFQ